MKDVIVKKSKLHGKGVFAARDFAKGEIVMKWNCTKLTKKDVDELSEKEKRFVSKFGRKYILFRTPDRHVNHAHKPNTKAAGMKNVATRDIKKGEEITTDYTKEGIKINFPIREN